MDKNIKLVSFDIFDTLLFRLVANPEDVFGIMYDRNKVLVEKKFTRKRWIAFRKTMERMARQEAERKGKQEVTINDIYNMGRNLELDLDALIQKEFECECELCFLNPYMIEEIKRVRQSGKKVVLLSDMYWPLSYMQKLLKKCGFEIDIVEKIYVSSEYGTSKYVGGLYEKVLQDYGVQPSEYLHIGDNEYVDFQQAKKKGIHAQLYGIMSQARMKYPFLNFEEEHSNNLNMLPIRILSNEKYSGSNERERFWHTVGAMIYGPLIVGAAEYVIDVAIKNDIKKILPLMREGYFLAKVLEKIVSIKKYPLEVKPLYVSRAAMQKAIEIEEEGRDAIQYFKDMGMEQPFITFDIGYAGTIGAYIDSLLNKYGITSKGIHCLVLERCRALPIIIEGSDIRGYIGAEEDHEVRKVFSWIFEMSFMCDKGTTIGYQKSENQIVPKLLPISYSDNEQMSDAEACQMGILHFAEQYYSIKETKSNISMDAMDNYQLVVRLFSSPTIHEVNYIRNMEYDENLGKQFLWKAIEEKALQKFKKSGFKSFENCETERDAEWIPGMQTLVQPWYCYEKLLYNSYEYAEIECLNSLKKYLQGIGNEKFVLVGYGEWGKRIVKLLCICNCIEQLEAIADNNVSAHGLQICGKEIKGIEEEFVTNKYLISIANSQHIEKLEQQIKMSKGNNAEIHIIWKEE